MGLDTSIRIKQCTACGVPKNTNEFHARATQCKECRKKLSAEWRSHHKSSLSEYSKIHTKELNIKVFNILGNSCKECSETEFEFLTVDHINNDRKLERSYSSHAWKYDIITGRVDVSKYQVLCRNCNEAKQRMNPVNLLKMRVLTGRYKTCSICGINKDISEFSTSSHNHGKHCIDSNCHVCLMLERRILRDRCYQLFGGLCKCCGINDPYKLNIDHINNDGADRRRSGEHRTGNSLYRQILNKTLDRKNFQLLCANCNYSKLVHGACIHSIKVAA
jgi:hypothetical protein